MKLKTSALLVGLLASIASAASAAMTLERTQGANYIPYNDLMMQGRWYNFRVTNPGIFNNLKIKVVNADPTLVDFQSIGLVTSYPESGVTAYECGVDANAQLTFSIRINGVSNPTIQIINVQNSGNRRDDPTAVQPYPTTYQITPNNPSPVAGQPFAVTIFAKSGGTVVTAYDEDVQVDNVFQGNTIASISGSSFSNGSVTTNLTLLSADLSNRNQLHLIHLGSPFHDPALGFPGDAPQAELTTQVFTLTPGAPHEVLMLFPGETLQPGIGKQGTPDDQVSGVAVSAVTVYRVDTWFNPILNNIGTITISFSITANQQAQDQVPPPQTLQGSPLIFPDNGPNPFKFVNNGSRTVQIDNSGGLVNNSLNVNIVFGSANGYAVCGAGSAWPVCNNIADTTVDTVLSGIKIYALDATNQVLASVNGTLQGALLSAKNTDGDRPEWVNTLAGQEPPQNKVVFSNGVASLDTLRINIAKVDDHLCFSDQNHLEACSNLFIVSPGNPAKILLTMRGRKGTSPLIGEVWTPGIYPFNQGSISPTLHTGETIIVEARITDQQGNLISRPANQNKEVDLLSVPAAGIDIGTYIIPAYPGSGGNLMSISGDFTVLNSQAFEVTFRSADTARFFQANDAADLLTTNSSKIDILPGAYANFVTVAPGEVRHPGDPTYTNGKGGAATPQQAGVEFTPLSIFVTDQYFNIVSAQGPFPLIKFNIQPKYDGNNFIRGALKDPNTTNDSQSIQLLNNFRDFPVTLSENPSSAVKVYDANNSNINSTSFIPIKAGTPDHFDFVFVNQGPKTAGGQFFVNMFARDKFGTLITDYNGTPNLSAISTLDSTIKVFMTPPTVTFTNGQASNVPVTVFTAGTALELKLDAPGVTSYSGAFDVTTSAAGYQKILLLGQGETALPGSAQGKIPGSLSSVAGVGYTIKAVACDQYFNPMNSNQFVADPLNLTMSSYGQFIPSSLIHFDNTGRATFSAQFYAAVVQTVSIVDATNAAAQTINVTVTPNVYSQVQILAPGEAVDPGNIATGGKKDPTQFQVSIETVSLPFNITLNAVDAYFNPTTTNIPTNTNLTISGAIQPSEYTITPPNGNVPFVNGVSVRTVVVTKDGVYTFSARDAQNGQISTQSDVLKVVPGPYYRFDIPNTTVQAGTPFPVTINLVIKDNSGKEQIVSGPNYTMFLSAVVPDTKDPARGAFTSDGSDLQVTNTNGVWTGTLKYIDTGDQIQVKVRDQFGRTAYSPQTINIIPSSNGLAYRITNPSTTKVYPDPFELKIELIDLVTPGGVTVSNNVYDRPVNIALVRNNNSASGTLRQTSAYLNNGTADISEWYSKAEAVQFKVSEAVDPQKALLGVSTTTSSSVLFTANAYARVVLIAPGESQQEGVYQDPTCKTGTPDILTKLIANTFIVRAADVNCNRVATSGLISFTSQGGLIDPVNPVPYDNSGQATSPIVFKTAGQVKLRAADSANDVVPQTDTLQINGSKFLITVNPGTKYAGVNFNLTITLVDNGGNIINTSTDVYLRAVNALNPDLPGSGVFTVSTVTLSGGQASIVQQYNYDEDIRVLVDGSKNTDTLSTSDPISFVPSAVYYQFPTDVFPSTVQVSQNFQVQINAMDAKTNTRVFNFARSNAYTLDAFSVFTASPAVLNHGAITFANGQAIVDCNYPRAETIFLLLVDLTDPNTGTPPPPTSILGYRSPNLRVRAGQLARIKISVNAQDDVSTFKMLGGDQVTATLTAYDRGGNIAQGQKIKLEITSINPSGQMMMNRLSPLTVMTDFTGQAPVTFQPTKLTDGNVLVLLTDADPLDPTNPFPGKELTIDVHGFPGTPSQAPEIGGTRWPVNTPYFLIQLQQLKDQAEKEGGKVTAKYQLNSGTWVPYDFNAGIIFPDAKSYNIAWTASICYPDLDPTCASPLNQEDISGDAQSTVLAYILAGKLTGYPSPFNPNGPDGDNLMAIQYPLGAAASVKIQIYSLDGKEVWHKDVNAGEMGGQAREDNRIFWDGKNDANHIVGNGVYIIRVQAPGQNMKQKVIVEK